MEAAKVTEARTKKGWSKAELSRQSGVNVTTISLIERGRFSAGPIQREKLAAALETTADELFGEGE